MQFSIIEHENGEDEQQSANQVIWFIKHDSRHDERIEQISKAIPVDTVRKVHHVEGRLTVRQKVPTPKLTSEFESCPLDRSRSVRLNVS